MITLLSVDPALHGCGIALWRDGKLVAAGYARNEADEGDIVQRCVGSAHAALRWWEKVDDRLRSDGYVHKPDKLVVELPQAYSRGANKSKGDPNKTVVPLAMVDAALAASFPAASVHSYQPHSWKGTTSKPERVSDGVEYVITRRVRERLTPAEQKVIEWGKSVQRSYDVADAVGVGLHHLGRFERGRCFPRE